MIIYSDRMSEWVNGMAVVVVVVDIVVIVGFATQKVRFAKALARELCLCVNEIALKHLKMDDGIGKFVRSTADGWEKHLRQMPRAQ